MARSLLRPLVGQAQPGRAPLDLSDHEIAALWELASAPDESLRLRFVEEALREPLSARQLRDQAPFSLQGAVGLDAKRWPRVEALLVLDQLQRHYNRPFADQWDFVRFATQQKLGLDLTTPPRRLAPVAAPAVQR